MMSASVGHHIYISKTYHASNASRDPSFIFHHISGLNIDNRWVSVENAVFRQDTDSLVVLNVFHSHWEYANPTDPTKLICVTKANVVPYLYI
jgi:hypothetical protein